MIKAHIITWSDNTGKTIKRKKTECWIASNAPVPAIEVSLPSLKNGLRQSIYINLKEIIEDLKLIGEI